MSTQKHIFQTEGVYRSDRWFDGDRKRKSEK